MISLLLITLAAACYALIDTLVHHFDRSVFSHLNPYYWDPMVSWMNKYYGGDPAKGHRMIWIFRYPVQLTDAWHLFKSIMLALMIAAVVLYSPVFGPLLDFVAYGVTWVLVFNICYDKLFLR